MSTAQGAQLRDRAIAAARAGDGQRASVLFDQAVASAPRDASILNSAASHWARCGDKGRATRLLQRAIAAEPKAVEPLLNLAILLTGAGDAAGALDLLRPQEQSMGPLRRYWSIRAGAERAVGAKRDALASHERAVCIEPTNPAALEGRARLALETGVDAREHYRAALAAAPQQATAVLGYGQALEVAGEVAAARVVAERLIEQVAGWVDALEWLAELRWGAGERDNFTSHYASAAARGGNAAVYSSWCRMLAGVDRFAEAAEIAAKARSALGDPPHLALLEAIHRGEAGDDKRAGEIFEALSLQSVERKVHEARHLLRIGEPARAEMLTADAIAEVPDHVGAWALRDIAWRLTGDSRHDWLHGPPGLVAPVDLELDEARLATIVAFLDGLHDRSPAPVGQSVRGGTQTRGGLFDRHEPEVRWIEDSFRRAVETYRAALPPEDPEHPLLRHRNAEWRFAGSWSIRVFSGGRHTEHIHAKGLVSSAAYFAVPTGEQPANGDPNAGWLELGRSPPDLRLDLPALLSVEPQAGRCALFPSTLYHGTRPFSAGKRIAVATDVHLSGR